MFLGFPKPLLHRHIWCGRSRKSEHEVFISAVPLCRIEQVHVAIECGWFVSFEKQKRQCSKAGCCVINHNCRSGMAFCLSAPSKSRFCQPSRKFEPTDGINAAMIGQQKQKIQNIIGNAGSFNNPSLQRSQKPFPPTGKKKSSRKPVVLLENDFVTGNDDFWFGIARVSLKKKKNKKRHHAPSLLSDNNALTVPSLLFTSFLISNTNCALEKVLDDSALSSLMARHTCSTSLVTLHK